MQEEAGHIVETPVEARAGFLDRPTLVVLIVSTSLMIGVFAVLYIGFFCAVSRLSWRPHHYSFRTNDTAELIQCAPGWFHLPHF
jgi:hypothetical protein